LPFRIFVETDSDFGIKYVVVNKTVELYKNYCFSVNNIVNYP